MRDWHTFSVKSQTVNILGFECHTVSVTSTQLCYHIPKAVVDNTFQIGRAMFQ